MSPSRGVSAAAIAMAALVFGVPHLAGQPGGSHPSAEFGVDAAYRISIPDDGDRLTTIEVPVGRIRAGVYLGSRFLVEFGGGFAYAEQSDLEASTVRGELSLAYHFGSDAGKTRPYLSAGGSSRWGTRDGVTNWQGLAGGALGLKVPLSQVVTLRFEASYDRAFETDALVAAHEVRGLVGLSFLTGGSSRRR